LCWRKLFNIILRYKHIVILPFEKKKYINTYWKAVWQRIVLYFQLHLVSFLLSFFLSFLLPLLVWIFSKNSGEKYGFFESIIDWRGVLGLWYGSDTRRQRFHWKKSQASNTNKLSTQKYRQELCWSVLMISKEMSVVIWLVKNKR